MSEELQLPSSIVKIDKIFSLDLKSKKTSTKGNNDHISVTLMAEVICYNQLMLAQYNFLLSQKHKNLKETSKEDAQNKAILRSLYNDLYDYSYKTLKTVVKKNFSYVLRYFQGRNLADPRVCLKLIDGDFIISAFRDRESSVDEKNYNKEQNTAFKKICMGDSHYLCRNIPEDSKNNLYVNARITNKEKLDLYMEPNIITNSLSRIPIAKIHTNWKDCWERIDADPGRRDLSELPTETCYKSTLVIPLSLKRGDLDQKFIDQFDNVRDDQIAERLIFGFLCLDHQNINFFNNDSDLKLGYIFADILSLYLIARKMYIDNSTTFNRMTLEFKE